MQDVLERAARVRAVIFDVDGVLTDGALWLDEQGAEYKRFHVRDGHGIKLLGYNGFRIAVISGRGGPSTERRLRDLGVEHILLHQPRKLEPYTTLRAGWNLPGEQIAYVGDDLPDLPVMREVGLAVAVADAHPEVLAAAHYRTSARGGHGAARETCELLLQARGLWQKVLEDHFRQS